MGASMVRGWSGALAWAWASGAGVIAPCAGSRPSTLASLVLGGGGGGGFRVGRRRGELQRMHRGIRFCGCMPGEEALQSMPIPKVVVPQIKFCCSCGGVTEQRIPKGEEKRRAICTVCGSIHYQNPKMVVGCLVEHEGKVLLCRRNIEPSFGLWTLPAGFMEIGESASEGAIRETLEEARAEVEVLAPFVQLDIPLIGQSYIIFRARFRRVQFSPGDESLECALFKLNEIPFEKIAFSSVRIALEMYAEDIKAGRIRAHHAVVEKRPDASPSDTQGFFVRDHVCC